MTKKKTITIVVPCFNEELNVAVAYNEFSRITQKLTRKFKFTYIFVDNGSQDNTKGEILKLTKRSRAVKAIFLSRNFGPEASLWVGLRNSQSDAVISIECDLQSPPDLIPRLISKWDQGYNMVAGVYTNSDNSPFTSALRKSFYSIFKRTSDLDIPTNASGVGLLDRKSLEAMKQLDEKYRFYRGLRSWIGFKIGYVQYYRKKRTRGKSTYSILSYFKHAERGIFGFSYLPIDLMFFSSILLLLLSLGASLIYFGYGLIVTKINFAVLYGLALWVLGSLQYAAISILGKYIQVIVEETKNRPVYLIDQKINF